MTGVNNLSAVVICGKLEGKRDGICASFPFYIFDKSDFKGVYFYH